MKKISTLFPLQTVKDQAIGNSMKQKTKQTKQQQNCALLEIYSGVNLAGSTFRVLHRSGLKKPV